MFQARGGHAWQLLHGFAPHHQCRVDSANALYFLAVEVILWCCTRGIVVSVENPANSWLWAVLVYWAREHSEAAAKALNSLVMVYFHACCHGSTRRKHTGWLSTPVVYESLAAVCNNDHPHEPWGCVGKQVLGSLTSTEAHCPNLLAQRAIACLRNTLQTKDGTLSSLSDCMTNPWLSRANKPGNTDLWPEYYKIVVLPADRQPPAASKLLPPHFNGEVSREEEKLFAMDDNLLAADANGMDVISPADSVVGSASLGSNDVQMDRLADTVKYGVYHTPSSFCPELTMCSTPWIQQTIWRVLQSLRWTLFFSIQDMWWNLNGRRTFCKQD